MNGTNVTINSPDGKKTVWRFFALETRRIVMKRFDSDQKKIDELITTIVRTAGYLLDKADESMDIFSNLKLKEDFERFFRCFITYKKDTAMRVLYPDLNCPVSFTFEEWKILHENVFSILNIKSREDALKCYFDGDILKVWKEFPEFFPYESKSEYFYYIKNQMFPDIKLESDPDTYYGLKSVSSKNVKGKEDGYYSIRYHFDHPLTKRSSDTAIQCKAEVSFYSPTYIKVRNSLNVKPVYKTTSMSLKLFSENEIPKRDFRIFCILLFQVYASKFCEASQYISGADDNIDDYWFHVLKNPKNKIRLG